MFLMHNVSLGLRELTETKTNEEMLNYNIGQYMVMRKDRANQNAPGGVVAILIKKSDS